MAIENAAILDEAANTPFCKALRWRVHDPECQTASNIDPRRLSKVTPCRSPSGNVRGVSCGF